MAPKTPTPSRTNGHSRRRSPQPKLDLAGPEIQRFDTLRELPIGLPNEAKTSSCRLLNEILADSMVLYALYKKHHWLVAGPTFYQLHLLFDKHAEEQTRDHRSPRRAGPEPGIAVGDPRHAAELTTIPRPPDGAEEVAVMHRPGRRAPTRRSSRRSGPGIKTTEASEDWGSNDILMSDVLRRQRAPGVVPRRARRRRAARHQLTFTRKPPLDNGVRRWNASL